jgi:hypothetical protein
MKPAAVHLDLPSLSSLLGFLNYFGRADPSVVGRPALWFHVVSFFQPVPPDVR